MKLSRAEFLLLAVLAGLLWWFFTRKRAAAGIGLGKLEPFVRATPTWKRILLLIPWVLLPAAMVLSLLSSGELMLKKSFQRVYLPGIDIMLVVDVSRSMAAQDFSQGSRLRVAKGVLEKFIKERKGDRMGLVAFAGAPLLISPLTLDREFLLESLRGLKTGEIEDGTAIGLALAEAVSNLSSSRTSKVVVLLTDGMNNKGELSPLDAAKMAAQANIKIYTVGVGKEGVASIPIEMGTGAGLIRKSVSVDEATLRKMAELTGGRFFRATDPHSLREIFREIDSLEKKRIEVKVVSRFASVSHELSLLAAFLLLTFFILSSFFREVP